MKALKFIREQNSKSYRTIYSELRELGDTPERKKAHAEFLSDLQKQLREKVPNFDKFERVETILDYVMKGVLRLIAVQLYLELQVYTRYPALDPAYAYTVAHEVYSERLKSQMETVSKAMVLNLAERQSKQTPDAEQN